MIAAATAGRGATARSPPPASPRPPPASPPTASRSPSCEEADSPFGVARQCSSATAGPLCVGAAGHGVCVRRGGPSVFLTM
eukprot:4766597-Lingulodinium_polyedra.AAC.1